MKIRQLTESGREAYRDWLAHRASGDMPPQALVEGVDETEVMFDVDIDPVRTFASRFDFGRYIVELLDKQDAKLLLNVRSDGLWDWLTVIYFRDFGRKVSKPWHYSVTRKGHSGSLAYRHLARTAYEMYWRHGPDALVMLYVDMSTWGDLSEQLTSRQNVAHHRGYIRTANALYLADGKLRRGSASRVRPRAKRKPGETIGRGGVARLALAVRRLGRTYDTHVLEPTAMVGLLPLEFKNFMAKAGPATALAGATPT